MSDPFEPNYFTEFVKKYPADREKIMELNRDMWSEDEKLNHRLMKYNALSIGSLFLYTVFRGPLPVFSKYSRVLGVHRLFTQYLVAGGLSTYLAYRPYRRILGNMEMKLKEIDERRMKTEDEYIQPTKPISYTFKGY